MPMPNRHTTDNNYRYAFQGQELDSETGMEAFELRLWDGRIGRWLTVDPMSIHHSPYQGMANNPINIIDPTGGYPTPLEAVLMAAFIYGDPNITLIGKWELSKITGYNIDSDSGLKASLFERKKENGDTEYAYVYAGTQYLAKDGVEDGKQLFGKSKQYAEALEVANKLSVFLKQKEITFIGHSLGGGLANYSSLATGRSSITFDPAWVSYATIKKIRPKTTLEFRPKELQTNYISKGLSLHTVQKYSIARDLAKPIGDVFLGEFINNFDGNIMQVHSIYNLIQKITSTYGFEKDDKVNCGYR